MPPSPPLLVQVRAGPARQALQREPDLRAVAARMGEAVLAKWPREGGLTVVVMHAQRTLYSLKARGQGLRFAVHWAVLRHEADVLAALLERDRVAWKRVLAAWKAEPQPAVTPRPVRLQAQGQVHDLQRLCDEENAAHFGGALQVPIGWGRWPATLASRRIRLGSCGGVPPRIRIHPALDHASVPERVVRFIVFHELLHVAMPPRPGSGSKRRVHPPEFRARERTHPDYTFTTSWERTHVGALLLRGRPAGT